VDIALICHRSPRMEVAFEEMHRLCTRASETADRARRSAERILRLKRTFLT